MIPPPSVSPHEKPKRCCPHLFCCTSVEGHRFQQILTETPSQTNNIRASQQFPLSSLTNILPHQQRGDTVDVLPLGTQRGPQTCLPRDTQTHRSPNGACISSKALSRTCQPNNGKRQLSQHLLGNLFTVIQHQPQLQDPKSFPPSLS